MATVLKKTVLVQLASFSRKVEFEVPSETDKKTEREVLVEQIRASYKERIKIEDTITLQIKDEDWGGLFVDFFTENIPDKSVFKIIVEKKEVCVNFNSLHSAGLHV